MPQAFYLVPVPEGGSPPDRPQPPGYPNRPEQGLPPWERPTDPGYGRPEGGGNYPSHGLPGWERPTDPGYGRPEGGRDHIWWGGGRPNRPDNSLPPPFGTGPVDPGWGVGHPGRVNHPLLWLLPWLIKPATSQQAVPPPNTGEKPDPDKTYIQVLVAVGPGTFKWAWITEDASGAEPKAQ